MKKDVTTDSAVVSEILSAAQVLHLALITENGPYSVPVNFAHERAQDGRTVIYIHSGIGGTKASALAAHPLCSFSTVSECTLRTAEMACKFGYHFRSVMGTGAARFLEGDERMHGLGVIMRKYAGSDDFPYSDKALAVTAVIAIDVSHATARIKGS